jgi:hypothetical protein
LALLVIIDANELHAHASLSRLGRDPHQLLGAHGLLYPFKLRSVASPS